MFGYFMNKYEGGALEGANSSLVLKRTKIYRLSPLSVSLYISRTSRWPTVFSKILLQLTIKNKETS